MCSRAAATHHVIGKGNPLFIEAPLRVSAPGMFFPHCPGPLHPCTSSLAFLFGLWCPRAGAEATQCSECSVPARAGGRVGIVWAGARFKRLMSNPRDLSGLPCLAVSNHFALIPPREIWACLAGTSAVLSLPSPENTSAMRRRYSGRHCLIC